MQRKTVFLMSGQGSQYYHMGIDLHAAEPVFRRSMEALDAVVGEAAGFSLLAVLYGGNVKRTTPFDRTLHTHPALFMLQYSLAQTLLARGIEPDYLLGTSLGEYVAAALAGVGSPEQQCAAHPAAQGAARRAALRPGRDARGARRPRTL